MARLRAVWQASYPAFYKLREEKMKQLIYTLEMVAVVLAGVVIIGCGDDRTEEPESVSINAACSNISVRTAGTRFEVSCSNEDDQQSCEMCFDEEFREDIEEGLSVVSCVELLQDNGICDEIVTTRVIASGYFREA